MPQPSLLSLALALGSIAVSATRALAAPPAPEIFAPGVISAAGNDADPAFTPDGNTVVFCRNATLLVSHRRRDAWSRPEIAPFSGEWGDQQPAMSPDGTFLVFVSNRPVAAGGKKTGGNLWKVARTAGGWGAPQHLSALINRGEGIWAPSVTADGSLYFIKRESPGAPMRIWRSQLTGGDYQPPVGVSFGDSSTQDVDPAVAPDESFIVFGSMHPGPDAHERLYISFRDAHGWSAPIDLGAEVNGDGSTDTNEARLGPDHRTLYFSTDRATRPRFPRTRDQAEADLARIAAWDNGTQNIWSVSLVPWLDRKHS